MVMAVVLARYSLYYALEQVSASVEETIEQHISNEKGDKPTSQQNTKRKGRKPCPKLIVPVD